MDLEFIGDEKKMYLEIQDEYYPKKNNGEVLFKDIDKLNKEISLFEDDHCHIKICECEMTSHKPIFKNGENNGWKDEKIKYHSLEEDDDIAYSESNFRHADEFAELLQSYIISGGFKLIYSISAGNNYTQYMSFGYLIELGNKTPIDFEFIEIPYKLNSKVNKLINDYNNGGLK
ncbi:MAG: hypothetical protein ACYC97_09720 [Metallibacterium sp.]